MKNITLAIFLLVGFSSIGQLSFSIIGSDPAYCRLYSFQNGNGVVYAAATGGTPDYTYEWRDLQTGATNGSTTWGGLNPGCYEITVTDDIGAMLIDTVCVDSLMPIADFELTDGTIAPSGSDYYGFGTSTGRFISTSQNICNPSAPGCDTALFWNFNSPSGAWWLQNEFDTTYWQTFYTSPGVYDIAHVAINLNGCSDTIVKTVNIFGPLETEEVESKSFSAHIANQQLKLTNGTNNAVEVLIFSITGQLVFSTSLIENSATIDFNYPSGVYIVHFTSLESNMSIEPIKILIP